MLLIFASSIRASSDIQGQSIRASSDLRGRGIRQACIQDVRFPVLALVRYSGDSIVTDLDAAMKPSLAELLPHYDPATPLDEASTIPYSWYIDERIAVLERSTTFARTWQMAGRVDQVRNPGDYITCEIAGEPILAVRGDDGVLRGFFNVCRHHAAAVMTENRTTSWLRTEPKTDPICG